MMHRLYSFISQTSKSTYSTLILAAFFFIEAIFFLPVDPLLIVFCAEDRKNAMWYGMVATTASVVGGIAGYYLGYLLWESIGASLIKYFSSTGAFNLACSKYKIYEHWAVLIAGFTPFPYKVITISAGFCQLPLQPFIACSLISRGARFMLIAGIIKLYGDKIRPQIEKYFNLLVFLFTILIIGGFLIL
jgi:membrane protein YqaA with SNARE-associated domain